jgi:hypothetical protein
MITIKENKPIEEKTELSLIESKDKSGVNVVATHNNHKYYLARILNSGEMLIFADNPENIGFKVDNYGQIIIKKKSEQIE